MIRLAILVLANWRTFWRLGVANLLRALIYRIRTGLGIGRLCSDRAGEIPVGEFYSLPELSSYGFPRCTSNWWSTANLFGYIEIPLDKEPPRWHNNPLTGKVFPGLGDPWWRLPDFSASFGDIKIVWESSRFDWLLSFAQRAASGEAEASHRLNLWLQSWCVSNPAYRGPNWKCGQEASIRVMHLSMAARILKQQSSPSASLLNLIELHLQRIAPTIYYAVSQDNNHGTSEAAALFIGGSWLSIHRPASRGAKWQAMGRRWLEDRVAKLVSSDGSFSQYSVNYHRVMLDTLSMAELWRRDLALNAFTGQFYARAQAATQWMRAMTRADNGDAPNLGANDGARLLPLSVTDYRDYRPSVQLAMALFAGKSAWPGSGSWNEPLLWLGLPVPDQIEPPPATRLFDDGGYACLCRGHAFAALRYPRFRFRPGQADVLHLDFWLGGDNVLRDAGSYSYNAGDEWLSYFPGTGSHNTVQFDGRDQMPRISRFLFGDWLQVFGKPVLTTTEVADRVDVGYRDSWRAEHRRKVILENARMVVDDQIAGFRDSAILRWRLQPGEWTREGSTWTNGRISLTVVTDLPVERMALAEGWESRYYLQKSKLPVLEVEVRQAGTIRTIVEWNS